MLRWTTIGVAAFAALCTLLALFFWAINAGESFSYDILSN
jgi:hypothetical protein